MRLLPLLLLVPLLLQLATPATSAPVPPATVARAPSCSSSSSSSSSSGADDASTAAFLGAAYIHRGVARPHFPSPAATRTTMGRMRMSVAAGSGARGGTGTGWGSRSRLLPGRGVAMASSRRASPTRLHATAVTLGDSDGNEGSFTAGAALPQWRQVTGGDSDVKVDVLFPPDFAVPKGVVHFVGGAVVGAFPRASYGPLLERLALAGYCVVATPLPFSPFDHAAAAAQVATAYQQALPFLRDVYGREVVAELPVFGLGHSLGAKLHVLLNSLQLAPERRRANVLVSFNNFKAQESVPLLNEMRRLGEAASGAAQPGGGLDGLEEKLDGVLDFVAGIDKLTASLNGGASSSSSYSSQQQQQQQREEMRRGIEAGKRGIRVALDFLTNAVGSNGVGIPGEFSPSPEETWRLVEEAYPVSRNLVVAFDADSIDQSPQLTFLLARRFPSIDGNPRVASAKLPGTHITPNTPASILDLADQGSSSSSYSSCYPSSSTTTTTTLASWDGEGDAVGQTWAEEAGFATAAGEAGRAAARKAKRELDALASAVVSFLDESPSWPVDPAGGLPSSSSRSEAAAAGAA